MFENFWGCITIICAIICGLTGTIFIVDASLFESKLMNFIIRKMEGRK